MSLYFRIKTVHTIIGEFISNILYPFLFVFNQKSNHIIWHFVFCTGKYSLKRKPVWSRGWNIEECDKQNRQWNFKTYRIFTHNGKFILQTFGISGIVFTRWKNDKELSIILKMKYILLAKLIENWRWYMYIKKTFQRKLNTKKITACLGGGKTFKSI